MSTCEARQHWHLAQIGERPDLVVPALTQNLNDTNETVRSKMAEALERFRAASASTE